MSPASTILAAQTSLGYFGPSLHTVWHTLWSDKRAEYRHCVYHSLELLGRGGMISIITVSYNAGRTIEQTLRSVMEQSHSELEHIVVDGASSDNTRDIIRAYESSLARWICEPDRGISDAMNKGLRLAAGDYVLYLNADDYLTDRLAIERVASRLSRDIVTAPVIRLEEDGSERLVRPRGFTSWMNVKTGLFHQATLCSRRLLKALGGFDTRYRLTMDYDLFLRAYRRRVPIRIVEEPFSVMRSGGVSTRRDINSLADRLREEREIHFRNCPGAVMKAFYVVYWRIYPRYRLLGARLDP